MTVVHDLRPLVIRSRTHRHAAHWLAIEVGVQEHQVIATHAAVEAWTLTEHGQVEYDEGFADWASRQDLATVTAEAPARLGISRTDAVQLTLAISQYRKGVHRGREGYRWDDEHDPSRIRVTPRRRRPRMN